MKRKGKSVSERDRVRKWVSERRSAGKIEEATKMPRKSVG